MARHSRRRPATRRKRRSRARKNPMLPKWTKNKWAYMAYGAALGFIFRDAIGASMVGELLDDTTAKVMGAGKNAAGAIGMGAVFDPYGAVAINPYGAIGMDTYGAIGMGSAHSLAAEHAARNAMHNFQYPPPGLA